MKETSTLNPQLTYYLMLFLLTVILRFIRAYRSRPEEGPFPKPRVESRAPFFYFGFELVNVAAGVFILLSEKVTNFVGTVMIGYVILVILSFFFEEDRVGQRLKIIGHLAVSLIVVGVTLFSFLSVEGLKPPETNPGQSPAETTPTAKTWRIALPYYDTGLNRFFKAKTTQIISDYVTDAKGATRLDAIQDAKAKFYSQEGPAPFLPEAEKSAMTMILLEDRIVAELQAAAPEGEDSRLSRRPIGSEKAK